MLGSDATPATSGTVRRSGRLPLAAAGAVTRAHQRQRGEGSDPVGVSSWTKPAAVWAVTTVMGQ